MKNKKNIEKHSFFVSDTVKNVLNNGIHKDDRTNTGTISVFGTCSRYNISKSFPLITSKRVFFKGVVEELLWILKGRTDAKELASKGVHIWDANGSREFLDSLNLKYNENKIRPIKTTPTNTLKY